MMANSTLRTSGMRRWIALILASAACTAHADNFAPPSNKTDYRVERSYELGVPRESYVGEQMVRVRDYLVDTSESGTSASRLTASENFQIRNKPYMRAHIDAGDDIFVTGSTKRDGQTYRLVVFPSARVNALQFLVDDKGAIVGSRPLKQNGKPLKIDYTIEPDTVRLVTAPSRAKINTQRGAINFELIYSGTTKDSFQLLYREYTDQDMARPAFSQTVVYDKTSGTIRFRRMQIDVEVASNEKIRYTVVSDGMQTDFGDQKTPARTTGE